MDKKNLISKVRVCKNENEQYSYSRAENMNFASKWNIELLTSRMKENSSC